MKDSILNTVLIAVTFAAILFRRNRPAPRRAGRDRQGRARA